MRTAIQVLLVVPMLAVGAGGQGRPDFSGTWVVVPSRSVWHGDGQPVDVTVFGNQFTAEQTRSALSIAIDNEAGFRWIYRLDGTVARNLPAGPGGPQETLSTAIWGGSALLISTKVVGNRDGTVGPAETTRSLKLNEDGTLSVEAPWGRNGAMIGSVYSRVR